MSSARRTPLWLWAAALAALVPLVVIGLLAAVAGFTRSLTGTTALALGSAAACAAVAVGAVVGYLGNRIAVTIAEVRLQALAPEVSRRGGWLGAHGTRELAALSAAVATLSERVRIADEVADRARRAADDASAGVFRLLAGLVAAEEGARGQLAAELHDTVAQSLLGARQLLASGRFERATDEVAEAEDQVRGLMARTRPPELRKGDLAQAVGGLCADLERRYGLVVRLTWPEQPRPMPMATAIVTYRFFQESLLNVVKHADVETADVELTFAGNCLVATVQDRGGGFEPAAVSGSAGRQVGLSLLRERARLAGGTVTVTSGSGMGTSVELRLPVTASAVRPLAALAHQPV